MISITVKASHKNKFLQEGGGIKSINKKILFIKIEIQIFYNFHLESCKMTWYFDRTTANNRLNKGINYIIKKLLVNFPKCQTFSKKEEKKTSKNKIRVCIYINYK